MREGLGQQRESQEKSVKGPEGRQAYDNGCSWNIMERKESYTRQERVGEEMPGRKMENGNNRVNTEGKVTIEEA